MFSPGISVPDSSEAAFTIQKLIFFLFFLPLLVFDKSLIFSILLKKEIQNANKVYIEADRELAFGYIVDIMSKIKEVGIEKVGIVTKKKY